MGSPSMTGGNVATGSGAAVTGTVSGGNVSSGNVSSGTVSTGAAVVGGVPASKSSNSFSSEFCARAVSMPVPHSW